MNGAGDKIGWGSTARVALIAPDLGCRNSLDVWGSWVLPVAGGRFMTVLVGCCARAFAIICASVALAGCASENAVMDSGTLNQFATRYTAAWCSQRAASVASFFEEKGSLKINDGAPAIGRAAITNSAQSFMTAFPDLVVKMDSLVPNGAKTEYHWTLTGTHTGPGGTGKSVRFSGYEEWRFGPNGLIAKSLGHFDAADYQRQLNLGGRQP